jgi:5-methylcytosine-specific restriction endonuclease McrA
VNHLYLSEGIISTNNLKSVPALSLPAGNVTNIYEGDAGMSIVSKKCTKCGEVKPLSEFYKAPRYAGGVKAACKICENAAIKKWEIDHPDRVRARKRKYQAKYRNEHPEKAKGAIDAWYRNNVQKVKDAVRGWVQANPEKRKEIVKLNQHKRRALKKASGGNITAQEWQSLKEFYNYTCLACKRREPEIKLTLDHVKPLVKGGVNTIRNAQPLCGSCNSSKGTKEIDYR